MTIQELEKVRDYFYYKLKTCEESNNPYIQSESEDLRVTVNSLNIEITLLREEAKRAEYLNTVNDMPEGYFVVVEEGLKILVSMSIAHVHKDCAPFIVYKSKKYRYGEMAAGRMLNRWYYLAQPNE
jgi:hypothetical protein